MTSDIPASRMASRLVRILNKGCDPSYRWRTREVDGQRQIERRAYTPNGGGKWFWAFQGFADSLYDVGEVAVSHNVNPMILGIRGWGQHLHSL